MNEAIEILQDFADQIDKQIDEEKLNIECLKRLHLTYRTALRCQRALIGFSSIDELLDENLEDVKLYELPTSQK